MEPEDIDTGNGDPVSGVDRLMVGLGVAVLALPLTFTTLVARPSRLSPYLTGQSKTTEAEDHVTKYLGPGLFFILSLLVFVVIMKWMMSGASAGIEPSHLEGRATFDAGYETGQAFAQLIKSFEQRLASGNLWSAVIIVVPVYIFALALALANRGLVGLLTARWTAAHAVGASLYIIGGIILWSSLAVVVGALLATILPPVGIGIFGLLVCVIVLSLTAVQTYGFASDFVLKKEYHLGLVSAAIPPVIIALFFGLIIFAI